ncbi:MAG: M20/M25/M40 family metallo-hydrolase [Gammaproteobacteria bacterium]
MSPRRLIASTFIAVALACATSAVSAAGLSAAEQRVARAADAETPRAIELLETLVNINSGSLNPEGVKRVADILRAQFEALGFQVEWVPMTEVSRAGHLVARHEGTVKGGRKGKRILLIGHTDTVFERDSPFQKYVRKGDTAEGPGVNDMKDGLSIMVSALRAMKTAGTLAPAHITIVLSGDEESPGKPIAISRRDMRAAAEKSDVALEFEALAQEIDPNGARKDMGTIARRGFTSWRLTASAKSGHSSGMFSDEAGFGAIYELSRILDGFRLEAREPNATFNVGLVAGGASAKVEAAGESASATGKSNIIPATAVATGDLRTLSNEQTRRVEEKMRAVVARHLTGTHAEISLEDEYPAMAPTEGNRRVLALLNGVNRDLGLPEMGELDPLKRGAGDIAFVADKVDALVGFGAAGRGSHAPGETVDLTSFDRQIKRTALLIGRLAQ